MDKEQIKNIREMLTENGKKITDMEMKEGADYKRDLRKATEEKLNGGLFWKGYETGTGINAIASAIIDPKVGIGLGVAWAGLYVSRKFNEKRIAKTKEHRKMQMAQVNIKLKNHKEFDKVIGEMVKEFNALQRGQNLRQNHVLFQQFEYWGAVIAYKLAEKHGIAKPKVKKVAFVDFASGSLIVDFKNTVSSYSAKKFREDLEKLELLSLNRLGPLERNVYIEGKTIENRAEPIVGQKVK